jgi:hypothetical protein
MTTPHADHSWAYALKPGDKAAVRRSRGYYGTPYEIVTFSRATATLLIFDQGRPHERRARKDNLLVQKSYARIEPLTAAIRDENAKFVMVRELSNLREDDLRKLVGAPPPRHAECVPSCQGGSCQGRSVTARP